MTNLISRSLESTSCNCMVLRTRYKGLRSSWAMKGTSSSHSPSAVALPLLPVCATRKLASSLLCFATLVNAVTRQ